MARPKLKLRQVRPGGASAWGDGSSYLDAVGERLRSYGPGYFGTRNLGVGASCHERILSASAEGDLPDPAEAIVNAARREHTDVIVVGSVGMSGRREFLLRNVPNRVSHNAPCTVVIVQTHSEDS